jgi:hypothetical protein
MHSGKHPCEIRLSPIFGAERHGVHVLNLRLGSGNRDEGAETGTLLDSTACHVPPDGRSGPSRPSLYLSRNP